jgi:hypothetical protein
MPTAFETPEDARAMTLRSLVISYKLLGTREFFVIHHTDCGMLFFTDEAMRNLLASSLETAELTPNGFRDVGKGPGSTEGEFIDWLTMKDNAAAVVADVRRIRNHPLIPKSIPITDTFTTCRPAHWEKSRKPRPRAESCKRCCCWCPGLRSLARERLTESGGPGTECTPG